MALLDRGEHRRPLVVGQFTCGVRTVHSSDEIIPRRAPHDEGVADDVGQLSRHECQADPRGKKFSTVEDQYAARDLLAGGQFIAETPPKYVVIEWLPRNGATADVREFDDDRRIEQRTVEAGDLVIEQELDNDLRRTLHDTAGDVDTDDSCGQAADRTGRRHHLLRRSRELEVEQLHPPNGMPIFGKPTWSSAEWSSAGVRSLGRLGALIGCRPSGATPTWRICEARTISTTSCATG